MIRRKRKATEKFLKKDIADLLANGLDVNAYGRVIITFNFHFVFIWFIVALESIFEIIALFI